jgi:hypothetical protein
MVRHVLRFVCPARFGATLDAHYFVLQHKHRTDYRTPIHAGRLLGYTGRFATWAGLACLSPMSLLPLRQRRFDAVDNFIRYEVAGDCCRTGC